jgi:hypothetical protein
MPAFISKVQHKTYEKGEFTDEKERSLAETLSLINNFPWDNERTLTDIQLTGPSVTICDEYGNYLKVGLYFNGKYCLYYLDRDNHLYEYHTAEMQTVDKLVTDFFNSALDVSSFEKHLFNIGNKGHFETCWFEYREKPWRIFMLTALLLLYGVSFTMANGALLLTRAPRLIGLVLLPLPLLVLYILFRIYYNAFVNRDNYLQISKGNPIFSFGYTADDVKSYNKADIKELVCYENRGSRNPNMVEAFEIVFKNGETLKLTNMLIGTSDFQSKFQDSMGNATLPFTYAKKSMLKVL